MCIRDRSSKQCVRHFPASGGTFCIGPHLDAAVMKALKRIADAEESEVSISKKAAPAPNSNEVLLGELRDVVSWACSARRVVNERGAEDVRRGRASNAYVKGLRAVSLAA